MGGLQQLLNPLRSLLLDQLAELEDRVDFEEDLPPPWMALPRPPTCGSNCRVLPSSPAPSTRSARWPMCSTSPAQGSAHKHNESSLLVAPCQPGEPSQGWHVRSGEIRGEIGDDQLYVQIIEIP
ncbi:MAG: hypothetical protein RLZZ336_374, partial [Cyanobacteriota bacterium]